MRKILTFYFLTIAGFFSSTYCFAELYDIVVIGGGVAGTYSAWRLSEYYKEKPEKIPYNLEKMNRENRAESLC